MNGNGGDARVAMIGERFVSAIPHVQAMGIEIVAIAPERVVARMPVRPEFLGDKERGLVHTGIVTSLIDSICGLAVMVRLGRQETIATLDLRVDYLRPTVPGATLHCAAECYRVTEQIVFLRACAWQHDEAEPVASSLATFMRVGGPRRPSA